MKKKKKWKIGKLEKYVKQKKRKRIIKNNKSIKLKCKIDNEKKQIKTADGEY